MFDRRQYNMSIQNQLPLQGWGRLKYTYSLLFIYFQHSRKCMHDVNNHSPFPVYLIGLKWFNKICIFFYFLYFLRLQEHLLLFHRHVKSIRGSGLGVYETKISCILKRVCGTISQELNIWSLVPSRYTINLNVIFE